MKKVIKHHDLYGDILYKEEYWRKVQNLKCHYNNSLIEIPVDMTLIETAYIEYELGIDNFIVQCFKQQDIENMKDQYNRYEKKVEERYKQYLVNIDDTMKKLEEVIVNDYTRYRKEWTEEEIKKYNSPASAKKILKVTSKESILDLVKAKHIIVYDDRVVIELRCPWYTASDAGVVMSENGIIEIGNGEMMQ